MNEGMQNQKSDTYNTVEIATGDVLYKDRGSKFIGYVYPISNELNIKRHLEGLKKKHHAASHICYAWQLGLSNSKYRINDDGEPNNSAGEPIYGQIVSKGLRNVLVVVIRYFGGTKLGVGGLISAYRTSAKMVLEKSIIIEKTIDVYYQLNFEYKDVNKVMRIIKENDVKMIKNLMELSCVFRIAVRQKDSAKIESLFAELQGLEINKISE